MHAIRWALLIAGAVLHGPIATAQTAGAPSAVIVLDGSGSMGGPLEGQTDVKFDMVSRALLQILPKSAPQSRTGLVTFGNRRKGDCSDSDVVIPPASGNADQFTSVFSRIGPNGKGPLVLGLRNAAKALPADAPGTLIVVHDDADNCRQDVCAAALDLAKVTPKVTVHVITISLDKTTSEKMSCLAAATGGKVFEARDAATVDQSLREALTLAKVIDSGPPQAAAEVPVAAPEAVADGPPFVRISAGLSGTSAALMAPVQWRVSKASAPELAVKEGTTPELIAELAAGTYIIDAKYGLASAKQTIEVAERGQTKARVSLEAASITISSTAGKAPDQQTQPFLTISALGDKTKPPEPVFAGRAAQSELVLPAGAYRIVAADGLAVKQEDVTLSAGDTKPIEFALGAGRLELSSVTREAGEPLDGTTFILSTDDPDAPQGRREVARTAASRPSFVLPAGTYYVAAKLGAAEIKERVAVGTGDVVKRAIALNGAWTTLSATTDAALVAKDSTVTFKVVGKGKDAQELARVNAQIGGKPARIFLPQGAYRIEASIGHLNVTGQIEAEITPQQPAALSVPIAAGELTVLPSGEQASAVGWDLRDSQGRVVQRSATSRSEKKLLLAPGNYVVRIESGDNRVDKPVELKAGDRRSLPLTVN